MQVGLDIRILQESGAGRGIATYIRGLLSGFEAAGLAADVTRFRYASPAPAGVAGAEGRVFTMRRRWREERLLADALNQVMTPWEARAARVAVLHAPSPYDLAWWYPCPLVVTVHDMAPLSAPRGIVRTGLEHHFLYRFVRRAARVIAVSEFSRDEILRHLPIAPDRVVVIPEAAQPGLGRVEPDRVDEVRGRLGVRGDFLLHVGGYDRLEPRKDLGTLLQAFAELRRAGRDLTLVLVGGGGPGESALAQLGTRAGVLSQVVRTGYVSPADLAALYTGASAFLFPSTYEGFGLPLLEAMACGTPCIAARAGSLPEVGGDAALYVEAGDPSAFAARTAEVLDRPELRGGLSARGIARAACFSWERTARLTWDVYRDAATAR